MKTKTKIIMGITVAALCAGGFTVTNSRATETSVARPAFGQGQLLERAKEKLGLTDEQIAQIKVVLQSENQNLTALLTQLHGARAALRAAIQTTDATETSVRAASAKVASVEADMAVERMKLYQQISPILTDEQRAKIAELESRPDEFMDNVIDHIHERLAE